MATLVLATSPSRQEGRAGPVRPLASARLQEMLDRGMEMVPDLADDGPDQAPDTEAYLKSLDLLITASINMMKLRKAEVEMGALPEPGAITGAQALDAILSMPVATRKPLVERLLKSMSPKGMKTGG